MKKHSQWSRFLFAVGGVRETWKRERSFQTEVLVAAAAAIALWALGAGLQAWLARLLGTIVLWRLW